MKTNRWQITLGVVVVALAQFVLAARGFGQLPACTAARFLDWKDLGCWMRPGGFGSLPDLPLNPGGNRAQCLPCSGMPRWWVTEPYINLWLADEPLSYPMSTGQRMSFRWTHRQRYAVPDVYTYYHGYALGSLGNRDYFRPYYDMRTFGATNAAWSHNWLSEILFWDDKWESNRINAPFANAYEAFWYRPDGGVTYFNPSAMTNEPGTRVRIEPLSALGYPTVSVPTTNADGLFWGGNSTNGLQLVYPDGSRDVFGLAYYYVGNPITYGSHETTARAFLTERIDPQGRITRLAYEKGWETNSTGYPTRSALRVRYVVDPDGHTNTFRYTNSHSLWQLTEVEDPYGRKARVLYEGKKPGPVALIDAQNQTNRFTYQETLEGGTPTWTTNYSGWITSFTTPYGTNGFEYYEQLESGYTNYFQKRAVRVTEPSGDKQLFLYHHQNTNAVAATVTNVPVVSGWTFDDGAHGSESQHRKLYHRNSFHWDKRQYAALAGVVNVTGTFAYALNNIAGSGNAHRLARLQHWLFGQDGISVTDNLSCEREPSPDSQGQIDGAWTWYGYAGKPDGEPELEPSEPLTGCVARLLPDGTTHFVSLEYNATSGFPAKRRESYTLPNGSVGVRTNVYTYASTNSTDLLAVTNAGSRLFHLAYSTNHQVLFLTNALSEVTEITYLSWPPFLPEQVTLPSGLTVTYDYFMGHWVGTNYVWYPERNLLKTLQTSTGRQLDFTYEKGLPKAVTDDRGLSVTNTWDDLIRLTSTTFPDGSYTSNRYDKLDLAANRDRLGNWTYFQHDALQNLTAITNANNAVTRLNWCGCGGLESLTDALANTTSFYYNNQGLLTNVVFADSSSLKYGYDAFGRLTSIADGLNRSLTAAYNNQGLLTALNNAYGSLESIVYDALDRPSQITDANSVTTTHTFDALDRLLTRSWPDGGVERFGYTPNLFPVTSYTNQLGSNVVNLTFDPALRLTNAVYPGIATNRLTYNTAGRLFTLTDGKSQTTTWLYDLYGHVTNKLDAAANEIFRFAYDANGQLTNRWTPAKGATVFRYDVIGNLTNVDYSAGTTPPPSVSLAYDALNRLTNMVDGVGTNSFAWTAASQWQSEDGPWPDDAITLTYAQQQRTDLSLLQPGASAWTQSYGYDSARRLTNVTSAAGAFDYVMNPASARLQKLILPGGAAITNNYDSVGRLLGPVLKNSSGLTLNSHAYLYDLAGERTRQTFKTGNYVDYGYDLLGQLTSAKGKESGGSISRLQEQLSYVYDAAGNLNFRTNNALVQNFNLNNLNELTTATRTGTYTVAGNTTTPATNVTVNGNTATRYADNTWAATNFTLTDSDNTFTVAAENPYSFHVTNSLTVNLPATTTFVYDLNGNLRTNGTRVYDYDAENQLATNWVAGKWKVEFVCDGFGRRRITREYGWTGSAWSKTNETRYVYDGLLPIQERDANNAVKVTYTRGRDLSGTRQGAGGIGGLLARTDANGSTYYHADGSGNITALINSNQLVVAKYLYDSFGNLLAQSGPLAEANRYRFSSKEIHPLSGLYYYGFRFYDPNLQAFLTEDPLGEAGGIPLHGFAFNSPLHYVDPYGLDYRVVAGQQPLGGLTPAGPVGYLAGDTVGENLVSGLYNTIPFVGNSASSALNAVGQVFQGLEDLTGGIVEALGGSPADQDLAKRAVGAATLLVGGPESKMGKVPCLSKTAKEVKLLGTARDNLLNAAQNPRLRDAINNLYRPGAKLGSGSSMDALRIEGSHLKKLFDRQSQLRNIVREEQLNPQDRQIVKDILNDIQNAITEHYSK